MGSSMFFLLSVVLCFSHYAGSQSYVGVNYGQIADNLPFPEETVKLLQLTTIQNVRLYGADPAVIKAFANTNIGIVIGVGADQIPALAADPSEASQWVNSNVRPYSTSNITLITVGNEILTTAGQDLISKLLTAMRNLQNALNTADFGSKIKVSTVHSMALLSQSSPPSSGTFNSTFSGVLKELLEFHEQTASPFLINPYPFFAYQSDPSNETLAFCLFQPNSGRLDPRTNIKYMNMFDAQVDSIYSALNAMGYNNIRIVVAETGWPYSGAFNEVGPSIENAKAYNGNLIARLKSLAGTPLMPNKAIETYIFALYDEDLKPGPAFERSFGLYRPDLSMTYDLSLVLSKNATQLLGGAQGNQREAWCLPKTGIPDPRLQTNLDYSCGQHIDCSPIQKGGACYEPNTVASHAAYAMNMYYQRSNKESLDCDFQKTAALSYQNPSYDGCVYMSGNVSGH